MSAFPGGPSALSDECPINLHYTDPRPTIVDVDAIVRDGRRIRRRRTTTVSLASAAVAAAVAVVAFGASHDVSHPGAIQPAAIYNSSTVKSFPPIDTIVVLGTYADAHSPYQSAIAWITQNGEFCFGSADMSTRSANRSILGLSCGTAPSELATAGPTELLPGWPVFQPAPSKVGEFIAIGLLRGTAATVEVTANGQTAEAPVHLLATTNGEAAGVYAVWLRAESDGSIHSADITNVRALDSSGRVVAQIPSTG
jgi:hypothetical protein